MPPNYTILAGNRHEIFEQCSLDLAPLFRWQELLDAKKLAEFKWIRITPGPKKFTSWTDSSPSNLPIKVYAQSLNNAYSSKRLFACTPGYIQFRWYSHKTSQHYNSKMYRICSLYVVFSSFFEYLQILTPLRKCTSIVSNLAWHVHSGCGR